MKFIDLLNQLKLLAAQPWAQGLEQKLLAWLVTQLTSSPSQAEIDENVEKFKLAHGIK